MADEPRVFSERLGAITPAQLQAALDRFDLGTLIDAQPAPSGLFGQNLFLSTTRGGWVLRGAPHYDGQFEKERFFSRLIHEHTEADAPWPFFIERSPAVFGWHYAIMPRLPGQDPTVPAVQRTMTKEMRIDLAAAMGAYLARIQSRAWHSCATYRYETDDLGPFDVPFADWFVRHTREWLHRCLAGSWDLSAPVDRKRSQATTDADIAWIGKVIEQAQAALAVPFNPVLVHTDYKENNIAAERVDDRWRITGVFDLGEAYIGDGEYDLARAACAYMASGPELVTAFVSAYARDVQSRPGLQERMRLYVLCDRLIIWEYGQRNGVWFTPGQTFCDWAEPFVEMELAV